MLRLRSCSYCGVLLFIYCSWHNAFCLIISHAGNSQLQQHSISPYFYGSSSLHEDNTLPPLHKDVRWWRAVALFGAPLSWCTWIAQKVMATFCACFILAEDCGVVGERCSGVCFVS